jgi:heme exporter protein C
MLKNVDRVLLRMLLPAVTALMLVSIWGVFFWVPTDANLGLSQRIFYFHVPVASAAYLGFALGGVASAFFLGTGRNEWETAAQAMISTAMMFATMVLVTGSIWARTAWGTWWTWDARLTTFLVLWMLFAAYGLLRSFARGSELASRYAAVLAIIGTLNIPLVMMATRLWRTIHPQVIRNPSGGIQDPAMRATFAISMVAFLLLFILLSALRARVLRLAEKVDMLELEAAERREA